MAEITISEVLALPVEERLRLAEAIWDSVAEVPEAVPLAEAQREELDRRLRSYYREPDAASPWPEVKKRLLGQN